MNNKHTIPTKLLQILSSEQAYHYNIIPVDANNGTFVFKSDKLVKGRYAIQVDWVHQDKAYYQEEAIYLSK